MPRLETPFAPGHERCLLGSTILDSSVVASLLDGDGAIGVERVRAASGAIRAGAARTWDGRQDPATDTAPTDAERQAV